MLGLLMPGEPLASSLSTERQGRGASEGKGGGRMEGVQVTNS
jgi:hypothetical protein